MTGAEADSNSRIVLYGSATCSYCLAAKMLLKKKGLDFTELSVGGSADLREEIMRRGGGRTIPQIFIDDKPVGGFEELHALDKSGELDRLLGTNASALSEET